MSDDDMPEGRMKASEMDFLMKNSDIPKRKSAIINDSSETQKTRREVSV